MTVAVAVAVAVAEAVTATVAVAVAVAVTATTTATEWRRNHRCKQGLRGHCSPTSDPLRPDCDCDHDSSHRDVKKEPPSNNNDNTVDKNKNNKRNHKNTTANAKTCKPAKVQRSNACQVGVQSSYVSNIN